MTDSTPGATAAARLRRYARPAKWGAGALVAIAALGFGVVPPVARHYAVKILNEQLGREVSIERVGFNPFTLTAEIHGARIMEADGKTEAFGVDRLRANLELESIIRGGPVLHEFSVQAPRVRFVKLGEGQYNWSDVTERLAAGPESEGDARFSVGNISVTGGRIVVDDRTKNLSHELSELTLGVPFVSNLPVKVDVFVEPSLAGKLDGNPIAVSGRTKPFTDTRETVLELSVKDLELSPWLAYLPFEPNFRLPSGKLATDIEVAFAQPEGKQPTVAVKGQAQVDGLVLQDKAGQPAVAVAELGIELADVQPLIGKWHFARLRLIQPEIDVVRLADGGINLLGLMPAGKDGARPAKGTATNGKKAGNGAAKAAPVAETPVPDFLLASARIRDGVVRFEDRALASPFKAQIQAINLDLRDLATSGDMPAEIRLDYATDGGEKFSHQDSLRLVPFELDGSVTMEQLRPGRYAPYLALALPGGELRDGRVDGTVRYKLGNGADGFDAEVTADSLAVHDFILGLKGRKDAVANVPELVVNQAVLKLGERSVNVAEVNANGAVLSAIRLRDGRFDVLDLLGKQAPPAPKDAAGAPWKVVLQKLAIGGASVRIEDRTVDKPVTLAAEGIALKVENLSNQKGASAKIDLDSRINKRGQLGASGAVVLDPLRTELDLNLKNVDLLPLQPYVLEQTKIAIARGSLTTKGKLSLETRRDSTLTGRFRGDVGVADFASVDKLNATDFVRWRSLQVGGIDARIAPLALDVDRIALSDFYTRLILNEQGQLNLREIRGDAAAEPADESSAAEAPAGEVRQDQGRSTVELPAPEPVPPIRLGRIELKGGNIAFSDRFVRPNYDANLTGMAGTLTGLSSDPSTIAKLALTGKVDNSAPVSVSGELNPFRQDRYLDIVASVKDFELTGLSSYSGKYVGYGIQKGKLSADLNYKIEDRRLTATNRVFVDQLTFGDKVDSPDATSLPVQFAVSLLKNGRGEIDLNLPISGTLDDPQFSVFGLVVRALVNLVGKAVTAPFSLLGAALSGGEELSQIEFEPGVAKPGKAQVDKLALLAKALNERPALKLEVTPYADPASDPEGLKKVMLGRKTAALKLKSLVAKGQNAPSLDEVEVSAEEYPALLKQVYRDADFKKPRNIIGLAKDLPVAEMEALIYANTTVTDEDLRALAQQRGQEVKGWLLDSGKVASERVFLLAPKLGAGEQGGVREVQFSLR